MITEMDDDSDETEKHLSIYDGVKASRRITTSSTTTTIIFNATPQLRLCRVPIGDQDPQHYYGPFVLDHGALSLRIKGIIQIDMTVDNAIWMTNLETHVMVTVNANSDACALMHPCGRVFQTKGDRVEVLAHDPGGDDRYALMRSQEVVFTSSRCPRVYRLGPEGVAQAIDEGRDCCDLSMNLAIKLFYTGSRHGPQFIPLAEDVVSRCVHFVNPDGSAHWLLNGVHVMHSPGGVVCVSDYLTFQMMASWTNASAALTTRHVKCMASVGETPHLFARRDSSRVTVDDDSFFVAHADYEIRFEPRLDRASSG